MEKDKLVRKVRSLALATNYVRRLALATNYVKRYAQVFCSFKIVFDTVS